MDRTKIDKMSGKETTNNERQGHETNHYESDQQIGQLYELMQAIRKKEMEANDPEFKPEQ